jgi:hypothetical protein
VLAVRITEGRQATYTFGGGASPATRRRIRIYQKEGGVVPKKNDRSGNVQDFNFNDPGEYTRAQESIKSQNLLDTLVKQTKASTTASVAASSGNGNGNGAKTNKPRNHAAGGAGANDSPDERRNATFIVANNSNECVSVWEQKSGDSVIRLSSAMTKQATAVDGSDLVKVLGRSISVSYPLERSTSSGFGSFNSGTQIARLVSDSPDDFLTLSTFLIPLMPGEALGTILQEFEMTKEELITSIEGSSGYMNVFDDDDIFRSGVKFVRESSMSINGPVETVSISKTYTPDDQQTARRTKELLVNSNVSLQKVDSLFESVAPAEKFASLIEFSLFHSSQWGGQTQSAPAPSAANGAMDVDSTSNHANNGNSGNNSTASGLGSLFAIVNSPSAMSHASTSSSSTVSVQNGNSPRQVNPNSLYIPMQFEDSMIKTSSRLPPLGLDSYKEIFAANKKNSASLTFADAYASAALFSSTNKRVKIDY